MYDIIIIGAGPAGLTAAIYARRAEKSVLLIEKETFGGQITLVSMLPVILMSFRWGLHWGLGTAFVHSLVQLFIGIKNLAYRNLHFTDKEIKTQNVGIHPGS